MFRGLETQLNDVKTAELKYLTNILRVGALKPRFLSLYSDKN